MTRDELLDRAKAIAADMRTRINKRKEPDEVAELLAIKEALEMGVWAFGSAIGINGGTISLWQRGKTGGAKPWPELVQARGQHVVPVPARFVPTKKAKCAAESKEKTPATVQAIRWRDRAGKEHDTEQAATWASHAHETECAARRLATAIGVDVVSLLGREDDILEFADAIRAERTYWADRIRAEHLSGK